MIVVKSVLESTQHFIFAVSGYFDKEKILDFYCPTICTNTFHKLHGKFHELSRVLDYT